MERYITRREALGLAVAALPCASLLVAGYPGSAHADIQVAEPTEPTGSTEPATPASTVPAVTYRAYAKKRGWQSWKSDGETAGTIGKSRSLGGFAVDIETAGTPGSIVYCAYNTKSGWQEWKDPGVFAGSKKRGLEAIRVKLIEDLAKLYDVYYRVNVVGYGWLDWARNGQRAGSIGLGAEIEALQVKLIAKEEAFSGKTSRHVLTNRWQGIEFRYRDNSKVKQILEVKYTGGSKARIVLRKKKGSTWSTVLSCKGYVGQLGIGKGHEGDARTPEGDFGITRAYGIKGNPGAKLPYLRVNKYHYWCGDAAYYNKLIDIRKHPHDCAGEHLIDYGPYYNYGLFIDYNTKPVVLGAGAAIFIHCTGGKPYTGGCVAMPESSMVKVIRNVSKGARVCIYPK